MRVATFNLRNGRAFDGWNHWFLRRRATALVLARLDADVVGLQEAYAGQLRYLRKWVPGYEAAGEGRDADGGGEHAPLLWRADRYELVEAQTRWYGDTPDVPGTKLPGAEFPRVATLATLRERATGRELRFANTHLDASVPENKVRSAEQLVGWLGDGPVVLVGDLNATTKGDVLPVLHEAGLERVVPAGDPPTNHGFGRKDPPNTIDHIHVRGWVGEGAWVVSDRPGGRYPSDHWPVVAQVVLR